jgi:heat shock protein HspQ
MKLMDSIAKLFPDDLEKQQFTKVLMYIDPFFGWSEEEANKVVQNSATKNARITHLYAEPELRKMLIEDENILQRDVKEIADLLSVRLQQYLSDPLLEINNLFPNGTQ